jgi:hypothetical protein
VLPAIILKVPVAVSVPPAFGVLVNANASPIWGVKVVPAVLILAIMLADCTEADCPVGLLITRLYLVPSSSKPVYVADV